MVKIRLKRVGTRKKPFYRVVVADSRMSRSGRFIENIGYYDPLADPSLIKIDETKILAWLKKGAQPTNTVRVLLRKCGTFGSAFWFFLWHQLKYLLIYFIFFLYFFLKYNP